MEIGSSTAQIWHREQYNDRDDEREVDAMSSSKLSEMTAEESAKVYGWVNGTPVYSRDEFVFKRRGFGAIESDEELIEFARKVTGNWHNAGWNKTFTTYYLGDYCLNEPMRSLTTKEYERLKELQRQEQAKEKAADDAREWKKVDTIYWADNSVEEIWRDKNGVKKSVQIVAPHGDACY